MLRVRAEGNRSGGTPQNPILILRFFSLPSCEFQGRVYIFILCHQAWLAQQELTKKVFESRKE